MLLGELVGPSPGWGGSAWAFESGLCVGTASPIFPGPTILPLPSVLGLRWGRWGRGGSGCLPPGTSGLTASLSHRLQGSSKPREEGPGGTGSTRGEPHPTSLPAPLWLFFYPLSPRFLSGLCLLVYHLFLELRESVEEHLPSSRLLSEEVTMTSLLPPKPQLRPLVPTPDVWGEAHEEACAGSC